MKERNVINWFMNHAKSVVINTNLFLDTSIMPEMYMIAKRSTHYTLDELASLQR